VGNLTRLEQHDFGKGGHLVRDALLVADAARRKERVDTVDAS